MDVVHSDAEDAGPTGSPNHIITSFLLEHVPKYKELTTLKSQVCIRQISARLDKLQTLPLDRLIYCCMYRAGRIPMRIVTFNGNVKLRTTLPQRTKICSTK